MDKVAFSIINKDTYEVENCTYYIMEDENFYSVNKIILPKEELSSLFRKFLKKYPDEAITETETNDKIEIIFYDVDYEEMMKITKLSNEYKKKLKDEIKPIEIKPIEVKSNNVIKTDVKPVIVEKTTKQKKINRKNNFQKTVATVSAAVFIAMAGFAIYKEISKKNTPIFTNTTIVSNDSTKDLELSHDELETIKIVYNDDFYSNSIEETNDNSIIEETKDNDMFDSIETEEEVDDVMRIEADNWVETEKYFIANAYYSEAITKYANQYGIDPNLALAIGIHERGIHSDKVDAGGAIGLFQIQVRGGWNWCGQTITAYNFETNEYDKVEITEEGVSDVFENIKVGCMMIQELLIKYNYNIAEAITAYNYGEKYLLDVLNACSNNTGFSISELNNINNLEWLNYRDCIKGGDPQYLENVCKYIPNGTILSFKKINGEDYTIKYENMNIQKNNHF